MKGPWIKGLINSGPLWSLAADFQDLTILGTFGSPKPGPSYTEV
jgi:hypothetical protein